MSRKKDNTMKKLKRQFAEKFPFRHVVIPERGEVWIKGSYPGCMAVASLMEKFYPKYKPCLAQLETIIALEKDVSIRETFNV